MPQFAKNTTSYQFYVYLAIKAIKSKGGIKRLDYPKIGDRGKISRQNNKNTSRNKITQAI